MTQFQACTPESPYFKQRPQVHRPDDAAEQTLKSISGKFNLMYQTMVNLKDQAFSPDVVKVLERRWRIGQVSQMIGKSAESIRLRHKEGRIARPEGKTTYVYDLDTINALRDDFGVRPCRAPEEEPAVLAFQTFKGGAGKSTLAVHFTQYMALKGYRCLLIDVDPQGTASTLFAAHPAQSDEMGFVSDELDYSLEEYLHEDFSDFSKCIKGSYFPGIDVIPTDLSLNNADYYLSANIQSDAELLNRLRDGIRSVWHAYDVIVLDPPPALGLLSLSVMNAANCLAIPIKPTVVDFSSTSKFLKMCEDNISELIRRGIPPYYHFDTFVVNNMNDSKSAHKEITTAMQKMFAGADMISAMMKDSAEIDNAAKEMKTVYDLTEPMTTHEVYRRCIRYLDQVNEEIETRIRKTWPSHTASLRREAKI